jgi:hypothetical protein
VTRAATKRPEVRTAVVERERMREKEKERTAVVSVRVWTADSVVPGYNLCLFPDPAPVDMI